MNRMFVVSTNRFRLTIALLTLAVLANILPLSGQEAALAAGESSVQQGLFYDSPSDGTSLSTVAARAKVIILTRGKIRYLNDLRASGFAGKGLQYLLSNEVIGPWTTPGSSCDPNSTPVNNNVAYGLGDFCKYIHPNESWFLHNSRGERLYSTHSSGRYSYHLNPAATGWREFAGSRMANDLYGANKIGYDGIFLDNVALRTYKLRKQLKNSDGVVKEFGSDSAYRSAALGYLSVIGEKVRSVGPLWANLIDDSTVSVSDYLPYVDLLDGFMNEAWAVGYVGRSAPDATEWNNILSVAETALSQGKGVLSVVQGTKDDYARQRYGVASYLLISNASSAFFRYANASAYREWWQYDNYAVTLGAPKGKRYQVGTAWRRDFDCGYVQADPTTRSGTIVQTECSTNQTPADTTAPTVSITTPTAGSALLGPAVEITAAANDNMGVVGVQFKLNGTNMGSEDTSSPYGLSLDSTLIANGTYVLTAVARDAAGNTTTSAEVSVSITNSTTSAPIKTITFQDGCLSGSLCSTGADTQYGTGASIANTGLSTASTASALVNGNAYFIESFTPVDTLYGSFYVKIHSLPTATIRIAQIRNRNADGTSTTIGELWLSSGGVLRLQQGGSTTVIGSSSTLAVGTVYRVGLVQKKGTGSDGVLQAYLATGSASFGTPFAERTAGAWTTQATSFTFAMTHANTQTINMTFDDVKLDSAAIPAP